MSLQIAVSAAILKFGETDRAQHGQIKRDPVNKNGGMSQTFRYIYAALLCLGAVAAAAQQAADTPVAPGMPTGDLITPSEAIEGGGLQFQDPDEPELVSPDTTMYQFYITDLESRFGAYAPGLSEQLTGLGVAYQEQGLYEEAVKVFKRAVHVSRINNGLYSAEQIPLLQRLISALMANGDYETADERQYYLYRVQRELYEPNAPQMSLAMLERARWEEQAYYLSVGETAFTRLLTMWELYRRALTSIAEREGSHSLQLLQPLNGLLQTQYLISTYQGESSGGIQIGGPAQPNPDEGRFNMVRASNYRQGQSVISAMREVHQHNEPESSPLPAEALVDLGNWHMWHQKRESAVLTYQEAWDELAAMEDSEVLLAHYFGKPHLLPELSGYNRDLEAPANIRGYVEVSFTVNTRGRVEDLEELSVELVDENDQEAEPSRLLRRLRGKIWRPRFEEREPVPTENIVKRYAF